MRPYVPSSVSFAAQTVPWEKNPARSTPGQYVARAAAWLRHGWFSCGPASGFRCPPRKSNCECPKLAGSFGRTAPLLCGLAQHTRSHEEDDFL